MDLEQSPQLGISEHAQKLGNLAAQLGYDGSLSLGALEDEVRFYQQRTVESCIEIGKRLLLIKEQTPHGEFNNRIEILNFTPRMAQKFMSAVLKFSKTNSNSLLQKAGNQTKLLELVMLDDDEIELIDQGGSIGDVNLDSIETMSVRELKKALRDAKADNDAKDKLIQSKDQKINQLDTQMTKLNSPAEIKRRAESESQELAKAALDTLSTESLLFLTAFNRYINAVGGVLDIAAEKELPQLYERVDECIVATSQRYAQHIQSLGVEVNFEEMVNPSWMFFPMGDEDQPIEATTGEA